VDGDIVAPRVAIAEGAHFRGSVDMQRKAATAPQQPSKPVAASAAPQAASSQQQPAPQRVGA
jgi:cytoskeletal protein CcmA (bactofilin family)